MKWTATESDVKGLWHVRDENHNSIAQYLDKVSAETIAAAPEMLELLTQWRTFATPEQGWILSKTNEILRRFSP